MNQTLLVELLTEELPPKALAKLGDAFAAGIFNGLKSRDLLDPQSGVSSYATPRRLAVTINGVRPVSPDKSMREKVLPVSVALDASGQPTAPLAKKLAALAAQTGAAAITLDQLERSPDGKAESLFYSYTAQGVSLQAGLQSALDDTAGKLPIPKVMSYQRHSGRNAGDTVHFVRPAHRLIALHGKNILPVHLLGLDAGYTTIGHRFLSDGDIPIYEPEQYAAVLRTQGKVIAGFSDRKDAIRSALLEKAGQDSVLMPESLLDEVTSLVEWPVVYECHFEDSFLTVPQECLILTMQTNQKYFALTDAGGRLRSRFLIVSNLETDDPRHIIQGNERVVRPRLSDAKFFFEQDKKRTLASRVPQLANVVYHNKLGNQLQRTERVTALSRTIATMMNADAALAERAATLAKTDLLTDMVGEFPELQGVMGTYYARHDGEPADVAKAASEHYQPRFAGDALPSTATGTVVALADKLETLVGIWGIGLQPTGDKDPFALRRHALGVLRMLIEKKLPLDLVALLQAAQDAFQPGLLDASPRKTADGIAPDAGIVATGKNVSVFDFIIDRLAGYLREKGYAPQAIQAVLGLTPSRLDSVLEKLDAVRTFAALPEAEALAAANKRIANILRKNDGATTSEVDTALLQESAEQQLQAAMTLLRPQVDRAFAEGDFTGALKALAQLRENVDAFFNDVMVMADDAQLRRNRLALLSGLHTMMNRVADISKLAA